MKHPLGLKEISILFLLVSFASIGAVLFTPALPSIQAFFNLSLGETQATISLYLIGYALGQLPFGPLANALGRKKTLYLGISLAIVGSLLCAFSSFFHSFPLLIFARFIQGFGGAAGLKVSFTMVADTSDQTGSTRIISKLIMAFAIMPGVAVAIGGFLTEWFPWETCFYFLALLGLLTLWLISRLPETAKVSDFKKLSVRSIFKGYLSQVTNKRLLTSSLIMGCGSAIVYIFSAKAPFIGMSMIGLDPKTFGLFNLIASSGMLLGSFLALWLAGKLSFFSLLKAGIIGSLLATLTMLIPFAFFNPNVLSLFVPMGLIYLAEALIFSNISSFALSSSQDKSNASAVLHFLNMSVAVCGVFLAEWIIPESAFIMPVFFFALFCVISGLYIRLKAL